MRRNVSPLQRPDGVNRRNVDVPAGVPTAELRPAAPLRVEPRFHRQATNQRKEIQRGQARLGEKDVPKVYAVILFEIPNEMLAILIYEDGELSASPG